MIFTHPNLPIKEKRGGAPLKHPILGDDSHLIPSFDKLRTGSCEGGRQIGLKRLIYGFAESSSRLSKDSLNGKVIIDIIYPECYHWLNQMNRKINVLIKITWITGIIWIICTSILALYSAIFFFFIYIVSPFVFVHEVHNLFLYLLIAVIHGLIVTILVIGVYKKSRICSVLLFIHAALHLIPSVILTLWAAIEGRGHYTELALYTNIITLIILVIFSLIFILGIWGTFSYHKALKAEASVQTKNPPFPGGSSINLSNTNPETGQALDH